jgi:hypothetical protein
VFRKFQHVTISLEQVSLATFRVKMRKTCKDEAIEEVTNDAKACIYIYK